MTELSQFLNRDRLAPVQSVFVLVLVTTVLTSCTWSLDEATQIHAPRLLFGASWHVKICSSPSSRYVPHRQEAKCGIQSNRAVSMTGRAVTRQYSSHLSSRNASRLRRNSSLWEKLSHVVNKNNPLFNQVMQTSRATSQRIKIVVRATLYFYLMSQKAFGKVACFRVRPHSET